MLNLISSVLQQECKQESENLDKGRITCSAPPGKNCPFPWMADGLTHFHFWTLAGLHLRQNLQNEQVCSASTYAENVALPAFVRCMLAVQQSIDISYPPSPQQQTCSSGVRRPDGTDSQTDGRAARQMHKPCSACCAGSGNNIQVHVMHTICN